MRKPEGFLIGTDEINSSFGKSRKRACSFLKRLIRTHFQASHMDAVQGRSEERTETYIQVR